MTQSSSALSTFRPSSSRRHWFIHSSPILPRWFFTMTIPTSLASPEFDDAFTAPLHGFRSTEDYWGRASAKPHLHRIRVPALVVNARNDPFVPAWSLPLGYEVGPHVTLWQPAHGGHVGFPQGPLPGHVRTMPDAVGRWLAQAAV